MNNATLAAPPEYKGRTKYTEHNARRYQIRNAGKDKAELTLVTQAFSILPAQMRVLDVPCGGGRVTMLLAAKGHQMTAADLSEPMLGIAREKFTAAGIDVQVERQDVESIQYAAGTFDAAICFRLFHHFPKPDIRQRAITELCRVSSRFVLVSYFSPWSFTSFKRRLGRVRGGATSQKFATPLSEVCGYFDRCGFKLVKNFARMPLVHTLHLAVFERREMLQTPA
jgi:cyclopropane fatty-acyl-phospholipid synthase-like methyltransferase